MTRHMFRIVLKQGHWKDFIAAVKVFNAAATRVGLPAYRLFTSNWGTINEVFAEADFESSADIEARWNAAHEDAEFSAALAAVTMHYADGQSRDYVLSEEDIG